MRPPRWLVATGCVVGLVGAGTVWGFAQTTTEQDITCHIDASNVLSCPLPPPSTATVTETSTATITETQTAIATVTATETQTVPGPTTTVPGPTTTVPGPTTTVPGPTTTVPGPTTTVTTTVTATPTPTPTTTAPPPPPGFPNATNTGVPAGTTLTVLTGNQTISTNGAVIDSKDIRGCVNVTATNVTIKNSKIACTGVGDVIFSQDHGYTGQRVLIQDSEIYCTAPNGTAVGEANITVLRSNIHDCENGFDVNQSITVQNSYIHALDVRNGAHADGLQFAKHVAPNGTTVVNGALNVTITGNRIEAWATSGAGGNSAVFSDGWHAGGDTNILVQANLLDGGSFTLYCETAPGPSYRVLSNHFGRRAAYGPTDLCNSPGVTFTGNVWDDTGQPVPAG